jgi:hypothetical protein
VWVNAFAGVGLYIIDRSSISTISAWSQHPMKEMGRDGRDMDLAQYAIQSYENETL